MPYIKPEDKAAAHFNPRTAGELNFKLTLTIIDYLMFRGLGYATINEVMGALESAKQEFYRRVAVPYENQKIHDNGDVYPDELAGWSRP